MPPHYVFRLAAEPPAAGHAGRPRAYFGAYGPSQDIPVQPGRQPPHFLNRSVISGT